MHKRKTPLETIYEDDENILPVVKKDPVKFIEQSSRLPYYICSCMIMGCFLTLTLIIAFSLNPYLFNKHSIQKSPEPISNVPINVDGQLPIAMHIIKQFDIFSQQVHQRLDLQPNTIAYSTSTIFDSLSNNQNQREILWIYSHLKYPQACIDNDQCKENLNSKLKTSFTELSNFLTTIEIDSYDDKRIQLDWCSLIENRTRAILVSLVSVITINQSTTESMILGDRIHCENLDLSKAIDRIIQEDHQKLTDEIGFNDDRYRNKEETNVTSSHPTYYPKYIDHHPYKETSYCPNDFDTQIFLMWNSF